MTRLVTGGTGFIGRHLLRELAKREGTTYVLVRPRSRERLQIFIDRLGAGSNLVPVSGDITTQGLGISAADHERLAGAEVFHLAAVYDLEASEETNEAANVGGTRNVVEFANDIAAGRIHHVS